MMCHPVDRVDVAFGELMCLCVGYPSEKYVERVLLLERYDVSGGGDGGESRDGEIGEGGERERLILAYFGYENEIWFEVCDGELYPW